MFKIIAFLMLALVMAQTPAAAQNTLKAVPMRPTTDKEQWETGRPVKCIDVEGISGAIVVDPRTVDVFVKNGRRWRIRFTNSCSQISYYGGFYYQPTKPGQICARQDQLISRAGGGCRVQRIYELKRQR